MLFEDFDKFVEVNSAFFVFSGKINFDFGRVTIVVTRHLCAAEPAHVLHD